MRSASVRFALRRSTLTARRWAATSLFNTVTSGTQAEAAATALSDGRFIVTWHSGPEIHARLYGADGFPEGAEFVVNTVVSSTEQRGSEVSLTCWRMQAIV